MVVVVVGTVVGAVVGGAVASTVVVDGCVVGGRCVPGWETTATVVLDDALAGSVVEVGATVVDGAGATVAGGGATVVVVISFAPESCGTVVSGDESEAPVLVRLTCREPAGAPPSARAAAHTPATPTSAAQTRHVRLARSCSRDRSTASSSTNREPT